MHPCVVCVLVCASVCCVCVGVCIRVLCVCWCVHPCVVCMHVYASGLCQFHPSWAHNAKGTYHADLEYFTPFTILLTCPGGAIYVVTCYN